MPEDTPSVSPLVLGSVTLVGWDGFSYVDDAGRTYWSGAAEPTAEDAAECLAAPRARAVPVPEELPAWRIKVVAKLAGLDGAIASALATLPEPARTVASAAWFDGNVIRRDSATVNQLAAALGLSAAQMDEFFRQAAALDV